LLYRSSSCGEEDINIYIKKIRKDSRGLWISKWSLVWKLHWLLHIYIHSRDRVPAAAAEKLMSLVELLAWNACACETLSTEDIWAGEYYVRHILYWELLSLFITFTAAAAENLHHHHHLCAVDEKLELESYIAP